MTTRQTLYVLWIDDYSAGDPLFVQSLARAAGLTPFENRRLLMVHGAAEQASRLLESHLIAFDQKAGFPVSDDPRAAALVARAYREVTKEIVGVMTEFGVPTVGFQGSDRGLVSSDNGETVAGTVGWVEKLLDAGAAVVVSALVVGHRGAVPVAVGSVVTALASALGSLESHVCVFRGDRRQLLALAPSDRLETLRGAMSPADFDGAKSLLLAGIGLYFCSPRTVFDPDPGARIPIFAENDVKKAES